MPIIKNAQYWKEYNQKRKEYLLQKQRERRIKNKEQVVINNPNCIQLMNTTESVVIKKSNSGDDYNHRLNTTNLNDYNQANRVQPKSEIETFNEQVYQRAGTKDTKRFFTFPDGKKIARTKCGCNPNNQGFYDWCRDDCQHFIGWRENAINIENK